MRERRGHRRGPPHPGALPDDVGGADAPANSADDGARWGGDFRAGTVGMIPAGCSVAHLAADEAARERTRVALPAGPDGGSSFFDGGDDLCVPRGARNASGAWEFARFALDLPSRWTCPRAATSRCAPTRPPRSSARSARSRYHRWGTSTAATPPRRWRTTCCSTSRTARGPPRSGARRSEGTSTGHSRRRRRRPRSTASRSLTHPPRTGFLLVLPALVFVSVFVRSVLYTLLLPGVTTVALCAFLASRTEFLGALTFPTDDRLHTLSCPW